MLIRSDTASARSIFSRGISSARAYTTMGTEAVMPWFPLPDTMTTGMGQPPMRASLPAAAAAFACVSRSLG